MKQQTKITIHKDVIIIPQKLVEAEPYKWVQVTDEGKRKIKHELSKNSLSGVLKIAHFTVVELTKIVFI